MLLGLRLERCHPLLALAKPADLGNSGIKLVLMTAADEDPMQLATAHEGQSYPSIPKRSISGNSESILGSPAGGGE
jgi:hypothetical protein